jgi:hypothetical protein
MTAQVQRRRRAQLKKMGYRQILLTLDPVCVEAAVRIQQITGQDRTSVIRAALLTHCALLEIRLKLPEAGGIDEDEDVW